MHSNGCVDLGFSNPPFTWARGKTEASHKQARLDKLLCSSSWSLMFQDASGKHMTQHCLDHTPILVSLAKDIGASISRKPFQF